jgi:hypothetical protein
LINDYFHPNNGVILSNATITEKVISSAAETELGDLYLNATEAVYLLQLLIKMGHLQPSTPIQTDNATQEPKHTKAMNMRFHQIHDREARS